MSNQSNLSELKKQLQELGISTSTPGLTGEERFKELLVRLNNAPRPISLNAAVPSIDPELIQSLKQLSLTEIRTKLTSLGISTSTPGLSGEDRWNALVQRLAAAVAGESQYKKVELTPEEKMENDEPVASTMPSNRNPPTVPPSEIIPSHDETRKLEDDMNIEYERLMNEAAQRTEETVSSPIVEVPNFRDSINDMKKMIKRISNKRSIAIAAQLSGESQDKLLKDFVDVLANVEHDISYCQLAQSRCEHKIAPSSLRSRIWKDKGQQLDITIVQTKLEQKRDDLKEAIKTRRIEIRNTADNHPEYGIQVEDELKAELAQMQFTTTKVSRARRKLEDTKSIDKLLDEEVVSSPENFDRSNTTNEPTEIVPVPVSPEIPSADSSHKADSKFPAYDPPIPLKFKAEKTSPSMATANNMNSKDETIVEEPRSDHKFSEDNLNLLTNSPLNDSVSIIGPQITPTSDKRTAEIEQQELSEKRKAYEAYLRTGQFPTISRKPSTSTEVSPQNELQSHSNSKKASDEHVLPALQPTRLEFLSPKERIPPPSNIRRSANTTSVDQIIKVPVKAPDGMDDDTQRLQLEIEELLQHAKQLQRQDDVLAAEILLERALDMDPMNILVLQTIAKFLHVKKGELARAEAFFNRALQVSQPNLYTQLTALTLQQRELNLRFSQDMENIVSVLSPLLTNETGESKKGVSTKFSFSPTTGKLLAEVYDGEESHEVLKTVVEHSSGESRFRLPHLISLLLSFGKFLLKSKGDVDAAALLYQQAVVLAPDHAECIANYAHFLTEHLPLKTSNSSSLPEKLPVSRQIDALFQRALQCSPGNSVYMMWYGKFLKKMKRLGPAEFMYRSAWEIAKSQQEVEEKDQEEEDNGEDAEDHNILHNQEATALCNYATFLFKYRPHKVLEARNLFSQGIEKYPDNAGLRKNYQVLEKKLLKHPELLETPVAAAEVPPKAGGIHSYASIHPMPDQNMDQKQETAEETFANSSQLPTILEVETNNNIVKHLSVSTELHDVRRQDSTFKSPTNFTSPKHSNSSSSSSRQPSRAGISSGGAGSQMQSRGSRRAQRIQQSLAHQVPSEMVTAEEKASFILDRVRSANSSASSSMSRLHDLDGNIQSNDSSMLSIRDPKVFDKEMDNNTAFSWAVDGVTHVSDNEDDDREVMEKQTKAVSQEVEFHQRQASNKYMGSKNKQEKVTNDDDDDDDDDEGMSYEQILKIKRDKVKPHAADSTSVGRRSRPEDTYGIVAQEMSKLFHQPDADSSDYHPRAPSKNQIHDSSDRSNDGNYYHKSNSSSGKNLAKEAK